MFYTYHSSSLCVTKNSFNCCRRKSCLYSLYLVIASESDIESSCDAKNCFNVDIGGCVCKSELFCASIFVPGPPPPPLKHYFIIAGYRKIENYIPGMHTT